MTIFGSILDGDIPCHRVYEDDHVMAFRDINPQAPTHVLIVPRRHVATVDELEDGDGELVGHMLLTARHLARSEGIADSGYRLVLNCKGEGGQTVYHIHLHLMGGRQLRAMG